MSGIPAPTIASICADMAGAAFELHRLRARVDQTPRIRDRGLRRVVGADGKIGHEQRPLHPARRRPGVVQHFLECDLVVSV